MPIVKLKAGESVVVSAVDPDLVIGGGPMPGGGAPVDPGYGIDAGLGYLRPTHPIVLPPPVTPPTEPVDPEYGIDEDVGYVRPEHPIVLPPPAPGKPEIKWDLKVAWTPMTGWIVVAIPGEGSLVPTPSKARR